MEDDNEKWETIYLNTKRWKEIECSLGTELYGYGKQYKREYDVWYVDKGSKDKKSFQKYFEITPEYHFPHGYKHITSSWVDFNDLINKNGYIELYSGLDSDKLKRWYFGIKNITPLYIITKKNKDNKISKKIMKSEKKKPKKGLVIFVLLSFVILAIALIIPSNESGQNKSTDKKEASKGDAITSMENEVSSMQSKWKTKRLDDINMIIQKNIAMKDMADMATFKAYIINEYEAYFNMQYKYVETDIWNKAQKKFPNSFQDQDSYCSEHNCKTINYGDNSIELNIINDNEEKHIDEINELVSKLYNN